MSGRAGTRVGPSQNSSATGCSARMTTINTAPFWDKTPRRFPRQFCSASMYKMSSSDVSDLSQAAEDLEEQSQALPPPSSAAPSGKGKAPRKAPRRAGLTDEQKEAAVEFLRERPYMYQKSHSVYKDTARRKREWKELAESLGLALDVLETWYRSMRTMLGRVKKAKSKSGSGDFRLTFAMQWVWDNLRFMAPFIETLDSDTLGRKRKASDDPQSQSLGSQPEEDPNQPGPSWRVPRPVAAPPGRRAPAAGSHAASAARSSTSGHSDCCAGLRDELTAHLRRADNHQMQFWGWLQWKTSNFSPNLRRKMERLVTNVILDLCEEEEAATPQPVPELTEGGPSHRVEPEPPRPTAQSSTSTQLQEPDIEEFDTFIRNLVDSPITVPMTRVSPRKRSTPRRIPQADVSTVCSLTARELGISFADEDE